MDSIVSAMKKSCLCLYMQQFSIQFEIGGKKNESIIDSIIDSFIFLPILYYSTYLHTERAYVKSYILGLLVDT